MPTNRGAGSQDREHGQLHPSLPLLRALGASTEEHVITLGSFSADSTPFPTVFSASVTSPLGVSRTFAAPLLLGLVLASSAVTAAEDVLLTRASLPDCVVQSGGIAAPFDASQGGNLSFDDVWAQVFANTHAVERLTGERRSQAEGALVAIRQSLGTTKNASSETPPIEITWSDDGALLLEWQMGKRRLGFAIEEEPNESSWFYISLEQDEAVRMSGRIAAFMPEVVHHLLHA